MFASLSARRAWIEIHTGGCWIPFWSLSLSARRAWIEIRCRWVTLTYADNVALRKESVDRNARVMSKAQKMHTSLSARRAWIEIGWLLAP